MGRQAALPIGTADALCGVGADYRIVLWNTAAEQLFAVPRAQAIGAHCYEIISGKDTQGAPICQRGCLPMRLATRGQSCSGMPMDRSGAAGEQQTLLCQTLTVGSRDARGPVLLHTFWPNKDREQLRGVLRRLSELLRQAGTGAPTESEAPDGPRSESQLTPREIEVLRHLRKGLGTGAIAARLGVSTSTIYTHVENARNKLQARTRLQALAIAEQRGLL